MTRRPARRGFTLLELLVAIGIMLVLVTLAAAFLPHLNRNKGVPNAATQLQGWINLSKQQAMRDGAPRGIRIIQDPNSPDPNRGVFVQYIEQPEPIAPRGPGIQVFIEAQVCYDPLLFPQTTPTPDPRDPTGMTMMPPNCGLLSVVTLVQEDVVTPTPIPANAPANGPVEAYWKEWEGVSPDDYFELSGNTAAVARIRRFTSPPQGPPGYPTGPTTPAGAAKPLSQFVLDRVIDGSEVAPMHLSAGFRILRAPRALVGEPMLQLHRDVYIDLLGCYPCPLNVPVASIPQPWQGFNNPQPWSPNVIPAAQALPGESNYMDILFNSSGVVGNAPTGQLILTLRHIDRPGEIVLLTVYTRTGKITAHVMYDVPGADPYALTRDGRSSGL